MKAIMVMFDSLNRRMLSTYGCEDAHTPNFDRLARHAVTFDNCYVGSMPCMPARRELHTGRYNFLHRSWGPLEPFDDSMPEMLKKHGIYTHLTTDHQHYWEDGGATYHQRYNSFEFSRGQEGDPWKGHVKDPDMSGFRRSESDRAKKEAMKLAGMPDMNRQDAVNRQYLSHEEDMPQAVTFRHGLEFIDENHDADNWFLQIETFDPHEPFFAAERFRQLFPDPDYTGKEFDWPPYAKVTETPEEMEHCRNRYRALVAMCDHYLGKVLDTMDKYELWDDTMLIVNTDHGFLLGEHGWWAKSMMPYYNEIAHIPMYIWDPRSKVQGERRSSLVQNIDMAPTILTYFGLEPTKDMLGKSLEQTIKDDTPVRRYALYGSHGNYINITDGRYVYMLCPQAGKSANEYTLMPTHMRNLFSPAELQRAQLAEPFSFTKGCKLLKVPGTGNPLADPAKFGTLLFDLKEDPGQLHPLDEPDKEVELANAIRELMMENDAPEELYDVFGLKREEAFTREDLEAQRHLADNLPVPGMDGVTADRVAFLQLRLIFMVLPPEQAEGVKRLIVDQLKASGAAKLTSDVVLRLVEQLPLPQEMKGPALQVLKDMER